MIAILEPQLIHPKTKTKEIVIMRNAIWNGSYREIMEPVYRQNKAVYKVREYREGLIVELPSEVVDGLNLPRITTKEAKTKIKISEVFRFAKNL